MANDLLRVIFFTEEGSNFGKLHFAALLNLPEVDIVAVVVSPLSQTGAQVKNPGKTFRDRIRHAGWRRLHALAGLSPEVDLTAFHMATEAWVRRIPFLRPPRIRQKSFIRAIRELAPDVIFCAGHQHIFPETLIQTPRLTTVNFHPSLLPECRGRNPWFWTILTGQQQTGVTAHHMTRGVDEGDIIIQEKIPLDGTETYSTLYDRLNRLSADMVPNIVALCRTGNLSHIPQRPGGSIFSEPTEATYRIDWQKSAVEIERLIRACMNHPVARAEILDTRVMICSAEVVDGSGPAPGEIVEISENGILVGTGGQLLRILEIRDAGQICSAREIAAVAGWQTGNRFY